MEKALLEALTKAVDALRRVQHALEQQGMTLTNATRPKEDRFRDALALRRQAIQALGDVGRALAEAEDPDMVELLLSYDPEALPDLGALDRLPDLD